MVKQFNVKCFTFILDLNNNEELCGEAGSMCPINGECLNTVLVFNKSSS